jgi:hypothetical protein
MKAAEAEQETDRMMRGNRKLSACGRSIGLWFALTAVIGVAGWQANGADWSQSTNLLDKALWNQAIKDRPAITDLSAASVEWRTREGASGDRIVERVEAERARKAGVSVIAGISGETIPAPVLAEQAAEGHAADGLDVEPAAFNGLTEGDRLTITTTEGEVFTFEVVAPNDSSNGNAEVSIRVAATDSPKPVRHAIRPVNLHPAENLAQQEL